MVKHVRPGQCLSSGLCKPRMPIINSFCNSVGIVRVGKDTIRFDECTRQLSTLYGGLFRRSTRPSVYPLLRRCKCVLKTIRGARGTCSTSPPAVAKPRCETKTW
jgi:hypothetical protein